MTRSEVDIYNAALANLGISIALDSTDSRTKEAITIRRFYREVLEEVLSAHDWPFARRRQALQLTGDNPEEWFYRYAYPTNCAKLRVVAPSRLGMDQTIYRRMVRQNSFPYAIEYVGDTKTICSDVITPVAIFTYIDTDPSHYDAVFTRALSWAIAARIALPLAKTIDHVNNANMMYRTDMAEAAARDANEEEKDSDFPSEFELARRF